MSEIEISESGDLNVSPPKPLLSSSVYDSLKKVVQIVLPAVASLYFTLAQIWGLPAAEQVVGTLAIVATFCGVLLGLSSWSYHAVEAKTDGQIVIMTDESGKKIYSLELDGDPNDIDQKDKVAFKVKPTDIPIE